MKNNTMKIQFICLAFYIVYHFRNESKKIELERSTWCKFRPLIKATDRLDHLITITLIYTEFSDGLSFTDR